MSRQAAVSCVMSAFNAERYVAEAVESVLAQTLRDLEFIIVDDGSTDETPRLLDEYASRDDRVRIIRQPNQGLTRSLNTGAVVSRGEFLARMDADDIAEPRRFERQFDHLSRHAACVALGSSLTLIDPDGDPLARQDPPTDHDRIVARLLEGDGVLPHPSAMIRMAAFRQIGGYREQFGCAQDLDLWLRLADVGTLANLSEPLLRYRLHDKSISTHRRAEQLACAREAAREARSRRGLPPADDSFIAACRELSHARLLRSWSRMAMRAGNVGVARKHAWSAMRLSPWSPSNLGLLVSLLLPRAS